jgi:predicted PurR-regulated permease PerM
MAKEQRILLDVSWEALLKVLALGVGIWAFITLRDVAILMLVVFIFVAALNPTVVMLQRTMSRTLAVLLVFAALFLLIGILLYTFVPSMIHQLTELVATYPTLLDRLRPYLSAEQVVQYQAVTERLQASLNGALDAFSSDFVARGVTFFGGFITFITGLVLSFYLLLAERNAREFFHQVLPRHRFEAVYVTVQKISEKMGYWIRGQLILMVIVGFANLIAYLIIGVPSPLPLAVWAGLCEAIPYVGPMIGAIPAAGVEIAQASPWGAVFVIVAAFVIQQLEAYFVIPRVMGRAIGLSPVFVLLAILVGVKLFGFLGAIIAVPTAAIISVVVEEWPNLRRIWEQSERLA